jgi:transposase
MPPGKRDDLDSLRKAFACIDRNNPRALRVWFNSHPYLTVNDHAQVAQSSAKYIRTLKYRAGLNKPRPKNIPRPVSLPNDASIEAPADWDNPVWLAKAVQIYSLRQIAKAVGRSLTVVYRRVRRYKITLKTKNESLRSRNPYCTHEWCYRHYLVLGYSQQKCAKLAGIRQQTFAGWLNRFQIPVRDAEQTERGRKTITAWEREFIYKLRQQPIVRRVYVRKDHIHVRYRSYFWDNFITNASFKCWRPYTYFKITADNSQINKVPKVHPEYGVDIEGNALYPAHIALSKVDRKRATLLERRLAIHEFARQLVTRRWIWPFFPPEVLAADMERMRNFDMAKYLENGGFTSIPKIGSRQPPGRRLMMHLCDFSIFWEVIRHPRTLIRYLNILDQRRVKFNFYNLLFTIAGNERSILPARISSIPDPVVYHALIKRLGLSGVLLDLSIGLGNRLVACAAAGLTYTTPDPAITGVLERGAEDIIGLKWEPYTGQKVDVIIYDEGWRRPDMQKVLPYLDKTKKLLVFAPLACREEILRYKPATAIRLRTRLFRRTPDLLFVW